MRAVITPNEEHPDWPTDPDPEILAAIKANPPKTGFVDKHALALEKTQERVLADARREAPGCMSNNLSWITFVGQVRAVGRTSHLRLDGKEDRTLCWIDGSCPSEVTKTLVATASFRYGRWSHEMAARYVYATFEFGES